MDERVEAVFLDDFGSTGKPRFLTVEAIEKLNKDLEERGLEEFGRWIKKTDLE